MAAARLFETVASINKSTQNHIAGYSDLNLVYCASQTSRSSSLLFCNSGRHWRRVNSTKCSLKCRMGSRSSADGTGTMSEAGRFGVRMPAVKRFFSSPQRPDRPTEPSIPWKLELFPRGKVDRTST
jgi:hypothetical protein